MRIKICEVPADAATRLPALTDDKSGIGVHYVDAFLKPMNVTVPAIGAVKCRRHGLKITLSVNDRTGNGLLRRFDVSPDPVRMLEAALQEAARSAGVVLEVEPEGIYLTVFD